MTSAVLGGRNSVRSAAGAIIVLLLVGCDGLKFCDQCQKQANPPPKTVKFDVNWEELGEAFKHLPTGGEHSITVNPVEMKLTLDGPEGTKTVTVADWEKLVAAVRARGGQPCPECPTQRSGGEISHNINHSTFEFRFAPPWFNADQRSLFTSYVIFPAEAKLDDLRDPNHSCDERSDPASICPDVAFHEEVSAPFLKALAQCATEKRVKLRIVGFASSSTVDPEPTWLTKRHRAHMAATASGSCYGKQQATDNDKPTEKFNLLVANRRAQNAAEMLRGVASNKAFDIPEEAFDIKPKVWCSHADMKGQRKHKDRDNGEFDSVRGLMNRRAEVRLAHLAGCVNVHPDRRAFGPHRRT